MRTTLKVVEIGISNNVSSSNYHKNRLGKHKYIVGILGEELSADIKHGLFA